MDGSQTMKVPQRTPLFAWPWRPDRLPLQGVEWFGYTLHLRGDKRHEVILAWGVTSTKGADNEAVEGLMRQAGGNLAGGRMKTLADDKAADDEKGHALLNPNGIRPVIEARALWKEEPERRLPGHDGRSNGGYDEAGTITC